MSFKLGDHLVGPNHRPFIIAEIAQAHDGSLGLAHKMIDAAGEAGADAVKFQTHIAAAESTVQEAFRVKFSSQDATRYDYWARLEFKPDEWRGLAEHARDLKLVFLSSAFSIEAFELLESLQIPAFKVASGELDNAELLDRLLTSGKPLLVSSGMSRLAELEQLIGTISAAGSPFCLFQCTSMYPTPLNKVGLNVIDDYRERFDCTVGLSDHSGVVYPALAALMQGVSMLEVHLTLSRHMFGPDVSSSLTFEELRSVCDARNAFHEMKNTPVNKDQMADELAHMRSLFGRSVALVTDLKAGVILTKEMLTLKKPAGGIAPDEIERVVGMRLCQNVSASELLRWDCVE